MNSDAKAPKSFDRLARVRENQRKSRARKQEYVRELEQRLAATQQEDRRMDIDNRIALQRMEAETWHIKNLIMSLGFSAVSVKRYLQLAEQNTVADHMVAIPSASTIPTQEPTEQQQQCTTSPSCKSTTEQLASETRPHDQNTFNTTLCAAADELLDLHNARGIDMDELRRRICPGVKETDLGCCRVQNHVLFHILDEISVEKLP
ncbi:hypothetical protein N7492_008480 [Penicillium capsulatum]|uniref:BZIP domain-containing protein n=1 Tax=Penicillium capsulatum TaxID=69766 RepID=A0A9W9HS14_9EURO|nr:hypothetical protein N7492_008480 [Penicillium capsulatum]KAJ6105880.1 hypothetical protein N7512_009397 [Penicillium capsulatum]